MKDKTVKNKAKEGQGGRALKMNRSNTKGDHVES
jgi:hypothetical protein